MKYIRTKGGVYEVVDTYEVKYVIGYTEDGFEISIYKENVIAQSDNLAELCDAYVFVSKSGETHYIYGFDYDMGVKVNGSRIEWDEAFKKHLLENGTVYGCIWTPKGLIYVAKMNEEGNLVLI